MSITVTLGNAEAVFTVSAIEAQIDKYAEFCKEKDAQFGSMNNIHKGAMRDLLGARDTLVDALRTEGYLMRRITQYDVTLPEWQDID